MDVTEPLTWEQICERFPDQHVVLVEADWINFLASTLRSEKVAGHGATRREAWEQVRPVCESFNRIDFEYTGTPRIMLRRPWVVVVDEPS